MCLSQLPPPSFEVNSLTHRTLRGCAIAQPCVCYFDLTSNAERKQTMALKTIFAAFGIALCGFVATADVVAITEETLPEEYEQISCLRSQLVQDPDNAGKLIGPYIDTKYCPSSTKTHLQAKFRGYRAIPWKSSDRKGEDIPSPFAFGCGYGSGDSRKRYQLQLTFQSTDSGSGFQLGYGNSTAGKTAITSYGEHTIDFRPDPTKWMIDGQSPTTSIGSIGDPFESDLSLYVFSRHPDTGPTPVDGHYAAIALYSMTLSDIGTNEIETVRRKFVPCRRRKDGVLGLYDVSGGAEKEGLEPFFTNADTSGKTSFWSEEADKLPKEYRRLLYIRSTVEGQQYINTGFKPDSNTCADFRFEMHEFLTGFATPFGSRNSGEFQFFAAAARDNGQRDDYFCRQGKSGIPVSGGRLFTREPGVLGVHDFTLNQQAYYLDGWGRRFQFATDANVRFEPKYDAYVFAVNDNDVMSQPAPMDLYSLVIWDNSVLVRNFVPCQRKSDRKVGLYDMVGKIFYTNENQNGEDFIPGPARYPEGSLILVK